MEGVGISENLLILHLKEIKAMNYQEENNKILEEWKAKQNNNKPFVSDGLLYCGRIEDKGGYWERTPGNENELYDKLSPKIMLLTKDFNSKSDKERTTDIRIESFRDNSCAKKEIKTSTKTFHKNVLAQVWGLSHFKMGENGQPGRCLRWHDAVSPWTWDEAREYYETQPIIRINVKKEGGGNKIGDGELKKYIQRYSSLIARQINLFNPDIIVCYSNVIFKFVIEPKNGIIPDVEYKSGWAYYSEAKKKIIINSYHPSYFGISREEFYTRMISDYERVLNEHPDLAEKLFGK